MRIKLIVALTLLPLIALAQKQRPFKKLIEETNHYLNEYAELSPFGDEYLALSGFELSRREIKELLKEADYDATLSKGKDSIQGYHMIYFFQNKILNQINQVVEHPDFLKNDIISLIEGDDLSITKSDDNKLFNFSLDEKTGGTYRSWISMMFYTDFVAEDPASLKKFQSVFASDGYGAI